MSETPMQERARVERAKGMQIEAESMHGCLWLVLLAALALVVVAGVL